MHTIEAIGLTHHFSKEIPVLENIEMRVREGSIYGFLGPNGAGKTTTLRLMLGLLRKQGGEISIFGKPFEKHRTELLSNIGSLIESPTVYGHLTATENLTVWQKAYRCPKNRIPEALRLVGLHGTGIKKAHQFSLGMKQRLGIAAALLHQPSLLVLDEPTNGLDPGGIIEIREMLRNLNREEGVTILISSHLLPEIEKTGNGRGHHPPGQNAVPRQFGKPPAPPTPSLPDSNRDERQCCRPPTARWQRPRPPHRSWVHQPGCRRKACHRRY